MIDGNLVARAQLKRLRGNAGIPIDEGAIIDNYCEVEFKESLDACETPEERKKLKKKYVQYYKKGAGKKFMEDAIAKLKDYIQKASDSVEELITGASKVVASNAIPAVITVGSATSTPNPAHFALENAQKKAILLNLARGITGTLTLVMEVAMLIHWTIPNEVLSIIQGVTALTTILNSIPG